MSGRHFIYTHVSPLFRFLFARAINKYWRDNFKHEVFLHKNTRYDY